MQYQDYDYSNEGDAAAWTAPKPAPVMPAPRNGQMMPTAAPALSELLVLGTLIQSVQQTQTQQMYLMRDLDARLTRLETGARAVPANSTPSYERATWWAIWGLLMLILGGALAVVMLLILLNIQFR